MTQEQAALLADEIVNDYRGSAMNYREAIMKHLIDKPWPGHDEAIYHAEARGIEAALDYCYPALGFDREPTRQAIRTRMRAKRP